MTVTDDYVATRRLASIYCSAVDDGDAERMASLFVDGGQLNVYEPGVVPGVGEPLRRWQGIDGFRKLIAAVRQAYGSYVHFLGNHWVEVEGDRATGEAYIFSCAVRDTDHGQNEEVVVIRYKDTYLRTATGWRFQQRNACRQWTTVRPLMAAQHGIDALIHRAKTP